MRFTKPLWLCHGGERRDYEVYSCHVSPDGTRLATAAGDGHVRIWSTNAILNASNPSYTAPKQLASLSFHSGTVHSVRFSPNGKYLASGADDKIVCIYNLEPGAPAHSTFGSGEAPQVENWRTYRRLFGHENDVQDLGWSYDSSILVSVGLDSKVVVWSGTSFEKLKTLSHHQSHVKGVTFDPANKYFATASDDRTIKIYRFTSPAPNASAFDQSNNFTLEATVSAPFAASPLSTYFRRPSWSPEGAHIAAANAVNGPVSSIAIINRGSWNSEINLIGHEGPVEVCAFSPVLFCRDPPPLTQDPKDYVSPPAITIVACAGQDKTLSVWNTSSSTPFVTTASLATKTISDLAWSPDGQTLYITSLDGMIAAIVFETGELGYPAPSGEYAKVLAKYGAGRKMGLAENPDALRLEEGSKAGELKDVEGRMGELMGDGPAETGHPVNGDATMKDATTNGDAAEPVEPSQAVPAPPKDPQVERMDRMKQRVTITKDGKKRVAPLLLSSSNQGEANLPRPQLQAAVRQGNTSDEPAHILDLSKPYDGLPKGGMASLLMGNKRKYAEMADDSEEKQTEKQVQAIQQTGAVPILHNTEDGLVLAGSAATAKKPVEVLDLLRPAVLNPSLITSQIRLAVPQVRTVILRPMDLNKPVGENSEQPTNGTDIQDSDSALVFEARNASGPSRTGRLQDRDPTRISLTRRGQTLWQDFLPRAVLLVTGNHHFWAASCEDGSLHIWTPAGRRLLNASLLESPPVILDCRGWWLLAVSATGMCSVWDISTLSAPHPPISLAPVLDAGCALQQAHLTASPSLMFARLNSAGRIIVGLSNGDGFAYNPSMYIWQRLSESWWAVGSQYWNTLSGPSNPSHLKTASKPADSDASSLIEGINPENLSAGILPLLERNTTTHALLKGRAFFLQRLVKQLTNAEGYEALESCVSVAHLENRLAAARSLASKDEFRVYLVMYAKRLGGEGLRGKVEELLSGLMGDMFEEEAVSGGQPRVGYWGDAAKGEELVGWDRGEMLREVVVVLGKFRDLQRVTVPYARMLGIAGDGSSGGGSGAMVVDGA